jgi:quercetin dioxygenase-like cupin family protein
MRRRWLFVLIALLAGGPAAAQQAATDNGRIWSGTVARGSASPWYANPDETVFVYVARGAVLLETQGGGQRPLHAGETVEQPPGTGLRLVGRSAEPSMAILFRFPGPTIRCMVCPTARARAGS